MVKNRKSLEKLYTDTCNIYEFEKIRNPETKRTSVESVKKYENIPCRLSFKNISSASEGDSSAGVTQMITLFINPDIIIKEGSIIEILREDREFKYECSGTPAFYSSHQEIILTAYKERA